MAETSFTLSVRTEPGRGVIVSPEGTLSKHEALAVLLFWAKQSSEMSGRHWTAAALEKVANDVEAGELYDPLQIGEPA